MSPIRGVARLRQIFTVRRQKATLLEVYRLQRPGATTRTDFPRSVGVVDLHHGPKVLTQLLDGRASHEPAAVVDLVDGQIWPEREAVRVCNAWMVRIAAVDDAELGDRAPFLVTEEREGRTQSRSKCPAHLGGI